MGGETACGEWWLSMGSRIVMEAQMIWRMQVSVLGGNAIGPYPTSLSSCIGFAPGILDLSMTRSIGTKISLENPPIIHDRLGDCRNARGV